MTGAGVRISWVCRLGIGLVLVTSLGSVTLSCKGARSGTHGDAGAWSCGAAAGICTCVPIESASGLTTRLCEASDCCFMQDNGGDIDTCTCRLDRAALDCPALKASLNASRPVVSCPPP